jgi:hypothetical protein
MQEEHKFEASPGKGGGETLSQNKIDYGNIVRGNYSEIVWRQEGKLSQSRWSHLCQTSKKLLKILKN